MRCYFALESFSSNTQTGENEIRLGACCGRKAPTQYMTRIKDHIAPQQASNNRILYASCPHSFPTSKIKPISYCSFLDFFLRRV